MALESGSGATDRAFIQNWLFLIESITVSIVVTFYLFYFNRVVGWVIAAICNLYFRRSGIHASVELEAVQISLLAGRILFKNARYHSANQTLRILKGHVTCRYWYLRTQGMRQGDLLCEDPSQNTTFPYRWILAFEGAEWFVYNRTAAFEVILDHLNSSASNGHRSSFPAKKDENEILPDSPSPWNFGASQSSFKVKTTRVNLPRAPEPESADPGIMGWGLRDALPIKIEGKVGVITAGNRSTPCILIIAFEKTHGVYSAPNSRSRHDFFRQDFNFSLFEPKIVLRTNPDFGRTLKDQGALTLNRLRGDLASKQPHRSLREILEFRNFSQFQDLLTSRSSNAWSWLCLTTAGRQHSFGESGDTEEFHGLPRFVNSDTPHPLEYAKVTNLLSARQMNFRYYIDSPGKVPTDPATVHQVSSVLSADHEDGLPPEYGVDVKLIGADLNYGPWADRQRSALQKAFFPAQRRNHVQVPAPSVPGDKRAHTELKVKIEVESCRLRIPIREQSKDWQWAADATGRKKNPARVRSYGWMDLGLASRSEIVVTQGQIAHKDGYQMRVRVKIRDLEVSSSVNHKVFVKVPVVAVEANLPTPLVWDAPRTWKISLSLSQQSKSHHRRAESSPRAQLSLIRDHIHLLTDLIKDWTSGPPTLYQDWVPITYQFDLNLIEYDLCLHLNDRNVIDDFALGLGTSNNTLLLLSGSEASVSITVPGERYRPPISTTAIRVQFDKLDVNIQYPSWSTHRSFAPPSATNCAELDRVAVFGQYQANDQLRTTSVDFLSLTLEMEGIAFKAFGHLLRLLMNIKDNYIGACNHFITQKQFAQKLRTGTLGEIPEEMSFRDKNSNHFEVDLRIKVNNLLLAFPEDPFDSSEVVLCHVPEAIGTLRNHNYFMSLDLHTEPLCFQPMSGWEGYLANSHTKTQLLRGDFGFVPAQSRVCVAFLQLTTSRLFGPRPRAITYFGDWRVKIGSTTGEIAIGELGCLSRAVNVLKDGFVDSFNALSSDLSLSPEPDAIVAHFSFGPLDLAFIAPRSRAWLHFTSGLTMAFNDFPSHLYETNIEVVVPMFGVYFLIPDPRGDISNPAVPWVEVGSCTGNVEFLLAKAPLGWEEKARTRRTFLEEQDYVTKRCDCLYTHKSTPPARHHLPSVTKDQLEGLKRSLYHDPHAFVDLSDDDDSMVHSGAWDSRRSDSNHELSETEPETDDPKFRPKISRREQRHTWKKTSMSVPPIPAASYVTALPSWRYYGYPFAPAFSSPLFHPMRSGLFPPQGTTSKRLDLAEALNRAPSIRRNSLQSPSTPQSMARQYLDFRMKTPLDVFYTPLLAEVLDDVLEAFDDDSAEFQSSTFVRRCLSVLDVKPSSISSPPSVETVMEFYILVPLVRIRILQDILSVQRLSTVYSPRSDTPLLSVAIVNVQDIALDGASDPLPSKGFLNASGLPQRVQASLSGLQFLLKQDMRTPPASSFCLEQRPNPSLPSGVVLTWDSGRAQMAISHDGSELQSSASASDAMLVFLESAAETLAGSYASLDHSLSRLKSSFMQRQSLRQNRLRQAIWTWVMQDTDVPLPACLRQSPFWSGLLPDSSRSSFAWYCYTKIRHLAQCTIQNVLQWPTFLPYPSIREKLVTWNRDHGGDSDVGSLGRYLPHLFPVNDPAANRSSITQWLRENHGNHSFSFFTKCLVVRFAYKPSGSVNLVDHQGSKELLFVPPSTLAVATKSGKDGYELCAILKTGEFKSKVDPHLSSLIQHIFSVINDFNPACPNTLNNTFSKSSKRQPSTNLMIMSLPQNPFSSIQVALSVKSGRFEAAVDQLGAVAEFQNLCVSYGVIKSTAASSSTKGHLSLTANLQSFYLAFCEISVCTHVMSAATLTDNLLLCGNMTDFCLHASIYPEVSSSSGHQVALLSSVSSLSIRVRRSLVKLEEFVRDWKQQEAASRIAPIYHKLKGALRRDSLSKDDRRIGAKWVVTCDFHLRDAHANFQPIPRLEVVYNLNQLSVIEAKCDVASGELHGSSFGLTVENHVLSFMSTTDSSSKLKKPSSQDESEHCGLLKLPNLRLLLSAHLQNDHSISLVVEVDFFSAYLSVDWLDTILVMASRYGEDMSELFRLFSGGLGAKALEPLQVGPSPAKGLPLNANIALAGCEFSFSGTIPMPRLQCRRVKGSICPRYRFVQLHECSISLAPSNLPHPSDTNLASFSFDLLLSDRCPAWANSDLSPVPVDANGDIIEIAVDFQRIQAVAATSAFKLLADCFQYLQRELTQIKNLRREEMIEAGACLERAWTDIPYASTSSTKPLLQRLILAGRCNQFGLAIPLDDSASDAGQRSGPEVDSKALHEASQEALLISFAKLVTGFRFGQAAHANVEVFAIQAVSQLQTTFTEHFESASHETRNSVFVPQLDAQFGLMARSGAPTLLQVKASASAGISIDLSPSFVLVLYAFLDVYQRDYHFMISMFEHQHQGAGTAHYGETLLAGEAPSASLSSTISDPWAIRVDFDTGGGGGGKIQLHTFDLAEDDADFIETLRHAHASLGRVNFEVAHSDVFFLPGVSAWALYNPGFGGFGAALHVDILVHSSQNTLNPTLLRFVTQMSAAVNQRLLPNRTIAGDPAIKSTQVPHEATSFTRTSLLSTELSFSLRIDQSELTITCLPTRALAKLQWASGVMFASGRLDQARFTAACAISKISAFLRHEHGFDLALKAEAGDLVASLSWTAVRPATSYHSHICSAVIKFSELIAEVDFSHLDICFLFNAIWLEQVAPTQPQQKKDAGSGTSAKVSRAALDTKIMLVAILIEQIKVGLRLSAGVGTIHLVAIPASLTLRHIPCISRSLCLDIGRTIAEALADGSLGGRGQLQFFSFKINVEDRQNVSNTILDIKTILGPIELSTAVASETILLLRTGQIEGSVQDDWNSLKSTSAGNLELPSHGRNLRLNISLDVESVYAVATLYTISRGESVIDSINDQFHLQSLKAEAILGQLPQGLVVKRQRDTVHNVAQRLERQVTDLISSEAPRVQITGSLKLCSRDFLITIFAGQFGDFPLLRMQIKFTLASLVRTPSEKNISHKLNFTTEGCRAARINISPNSISDQDQADGSWFQLLENAPSEMVLDANRLWISMLVEKLLNQNQVHHTFRAEMPNNIHISTDVTTHANLWSKFRTAWAKANEAKSTQTARTQKPIEAGTTRGEIVLIADHKPAIEDAKVQELWHAALPLVNYFKWNENLPRSTFLWVIKPLDNVVDFFESIYESTFARHEFKEVT